jgi:hypothetical protein
VSEVLSTSQTAVALGMRGVRSMSLAIPVRERAVSRPLKATRASQIHMKGKHSI